MKQALVFSTILVLAMAFRGFAAEQASESRPAAMGLSSEPGAVLDSATLWRHFRVTGPSLVRHADGALVKSCIGYISSGKIGEEQWDPAWSSPLPPDDWASPAFDDTAWPRAFLPQPARHDSCPGMEFRLRGWRLYDTAKVLVRGKFMYYLPFDGPNHELARRPSQFFDLVKDPYQQHNLTDDVPASGYARELDERLRCWNAEVPWMG